MLGIDRMIMLPEIAASVPCSQEMVVVVVFLRRCPRNALVLRVGRGPVILLESAVKRKIKKY
jgi:hypothetical protein